MTQGQEIPMFVRLAVVFAVAALMLGPAIAAALVQAEPLSGNRPNAVTVYPVAEAAGAVKAAPEKNKPTQPGSGMGKRGYA
jgi:hypothetical protein